MFPFKKYDSLFCFSFEMKSIEKSRADKYIPSSNAVSYF